MLIMELEKEKKLNLTYMKQVMEDIKDFLMRKILQIFCKLGKIIYSRRKTRKIWSRKSIMERGFKGQ